MEKQIFKVGDRVFDIHYGWGTVSEVDEDCETFPIEVSFENIGINHYTYDGKGSSIDKVATLSFTEYTLEGFSQERPINYEDYIGKWGVFISGGRHIIIGILSEYVSGVDTPFVEKTTEMCFDSFEPLTEEQIKILGLED